MLRHGRREVRIVEAALLVMAGEAALLFRRGGARASLAELGAGAALTLALRSALRGGRTETRLACLTAALVFHLGARPLRRDTHRAP